MSSLYAFVRQALELRGGSCLRLELLADIEGDPEAAHRLRQTDGFSRLLINMKFSGFIELDGDVIRRTKRRVGRRRL
jgi:hypothetical protein